VIEFTIQTTIARPVSDVFAYVTDPAKLPTWQTNTVSATPERGETVGLGTRIREVHRGPGGKELESLVEVSEFEPFRTFALHVIEGALPIDAHIFLEPSDGSTRMLLTVHGQPNGLMRIVQPLLRVALRRQFKAHCATLKRVLEER
jgi:uncharacterized protein YndB with AHSA1/START domain